MTPWIDGHGAIDPALALSLSADAPWRMLYEDTLTDQSSTSAAGARRGPLQPAGTVGCIRDGHRQTSGHTPAPGPPPGALAYTPSRSLRNWITDHDQHCRFPYCNQPPSAREIDHQIPFDHTNPAAGGWTIRINLALLCVLHHHVKTVGLWHAHMHPDRSITWTHRDTGAERHHPSGAVTLRRPAHPAVATAPPDNARRSPS
ncbi:HNH endonuclease [Williamsia herbipolensis]|uniref:HNH endonuclease n=1 Tax=Williamsia herbipolensis TaxID=1603258 RepID=A0AAU4K1L5_9NOCA|nr:HNH endonuclease signature motif containing protein [Williamsia herbipolensis]